MRIPAETAREATGPGAEPRHLATATGTPSADPARYALAAVRSAAAHCGSRVDAAIGALAARANDPEHRPEHKPAHKPEHKDDNDGELDATLEVVEAPQTRHGESVQRPVPSCHAPAELVLAFELAGEDAAIAGPGHSPGCLPGQVAERELQQIEVRAAQRLLVRSRARGADPACGRLGCIPWHIGEVT